MQSLRFVGVLCSGVCVRVGNGCERLSELKCKV